MRRRRRFLITGLLVLLLLVSAGAVAARGVLDGEQCLVEADTIITGDIFVFCGELRIEGRVDGHILGAARNTVITGEVGGSLYLVGAELTIQGEIGKDVHFLGVALYVEDESRFLHERASILSANLSSYIASGATLPGNITGIGYQLLIDGIVGGEIHFWGSALVINGNVRGDIMATVGNSEGNGATSQIETLLIPFRLDVTLSNPGLAVSGSALINGQLEYTGAAPGIIEGTLDSPAIFRSTEPEIVGTPVEQSAATLQRYLRNVLREFTALAFIGVILLFFAPRQMQSPLRSLNARPLSTLGVGMLSFIMSFPIVLVIVLLSILLILLISLLPIDSFVIFGGVVLGLANIGVASVFYFIAIYIARIVVGLAIGRTILRNVLRRDDGTLRSVFISLGIGLLVLALLASIPVVGWMFNSLALFLGLGAILSVLQAQFKRFRESSSMPSSPPGRYTTQTMASLPYFPEDARQFPPPIIEDSPHEPGAENLPDGFRWWDD